MRETGPLCLSTHLPSVDCSVALREGAALRRLSLLLPSSRVRADELGVSRSTVTVAFELLAAEGFIETHRGRLFARAVDELGSERE